MARPECTGCDDPHRSRPVAEWNDVDFDECAHFSALAADERRVADPDEARYALIAAARRKTNHETATGVSR